MSRPHVAIVGATGAVGHEFLRVLDERDFDMASLKLLASERSAGKLIDFRGDSLGVEQVSVEALRGVDIAFFSAGGGTSQAFARAAVDVGCVVIDNSSAFRLLDDVPLVVPEVNVDALSGHQGIIANPDPLSDDDLHARAPAFLGAADEGQEVPRGGVERGQRLAGEALGVGLLAEVAQHLEHHDAARSRAFSTGVPTDRSGSATTSSVETRGTTRRNWLT